MTKNDINQFADYLLEAFFNGAVNIEEELPPGFTSTDIQEPEEYIKSNLPKTEISEKSNQDDETETDQLLPSDDPRLSDLSPEELKALFMLHKMSKKVKLNPKSPLIHPFHLKFVDQFGKEIDQEELKNKMLKKPSRLITKNTKIKKSGGKTYQFYNTTLPAYMGIWYDNKLNKFRFISTCPNADECIVKCYARKGGFVQFPDSFLSIAQIVTFLLNDWRGFKNQMLSEINNLKVENFKKNIITVIRWHQAGDFFNKKYLEIAFDIAKETPDVIHYAYTKSISLILDCSEKPKNFVFNFSFGGKEDQIIPFGEKRAYIVPFNLFKPYATITRKFVLNKDGTVKLDKKTKKPISKRKIEFIGDNLKKFKNDLAKYYKLGPVDNIILYKDLLKIPYYTSYSGEKKWHVIVKSGDGDDAAMRKDVKTVLLLIH